LIETRYPQFIDRWQPTRQVTWCLRHLMMEDGHDNDCAQRGWCGRRCLSPRCLHCYATALPLRGRIESVDNQTLLVKARDGTMRNVKLTDDAYVFTLKKASLADIKPSGLVGIIVKHQMDGSPSQ